MAYRTTTTTQKSSRTQQPHSKGPQRPRECKVCIDAGKSVEEYTSHWVKDREGNVACPTLLNQKCLVCGKCGHTTSYCKMKVDAPGSTFLTARNPATNEREHEREHRIDTRLEKPMPPRPASSNKYALLGLMEHEAQEKERVKLTTFPALQQLEKKPEITRPATATATMTATAAIVSWANRLNSPPSPTPLQQMHQQQQERKPTRPKPVQISVSWGDRCE